MRLPSKNLFIAAFVLLMAALGLYYGRRPLIPRIMVANHLFTADVAVTNEEKQKGLGNRAMLPDNHGMLFVYDHPEQYTFWMKDMRFPIDIIWIRDTTIVDIHTNVPVPESANLPTYATKLPVNKVFEVSAGTVDRLGIRVGDSVSILKR